MSSSLDRCALAVRTEIESRFARVRAGVDAGFAAACVSQTFRSARGGVWMTVETDAVSRDRVAGELDPKTVLAMGTDGEMPFDDHQFEIAVLSSSLLCADQRLANVVVRETHRILQGGGCLIFSVDTGVPEGAGFTQRGVYELLRDGFDVVGLKCPAWWKLGLGGRMLTVCARRKNWRSRSAPIVGAALPVSSAMLSPRNRKEIVI